MLLHPSVPSTTTALPHPTWGFRRRHCSRCPREFALQILIAGVVFAAEFPEVQRPCNSPLLPAAEKKKKKGWRVFPIHGSLRNTTTGSLGVTGTSPARSYGDFVRHLSCKPNHFRSGRRIPPHAPTLNALPPPQDTLILININNWGHDSGHGHCGRGARPASDSESRDSGRSR